MYNSQFYSKENQGVNYNGIGVFLVPVNDITVVLIYFRCVDIIALILPKAN